MLNTILALKMLTLRTKKTKIWIDEEEDISFSVYIIFSEPIWEEETTSRIPFQSSFWKYNDKGITDITVITSYDDSNSGS